MFGSECLYTIDRVVVMVSLDFIFYHSIKYIETHDSKFTLHSSSMRIKRFKLGSIFYAQWGLPLAAFAAFNGKRAKTLTMFFTSV